MKLLNILVFIICISFLNACIDENSSTTHNITTGSFKITGLDISKYQGTVDFQKIKAEGISYVFIRATEGNTYQDKDFTSNLASARAVGLTAGAYHFYETDDEPLSQLKNFEALVSLQPGDLPPVVDIEKLHNKNQTNLVENIQVFLDGLESHYGVKPILYSGHNFANKYLTQFGNYPLWLAEYDADKPNLPVGWSEWTFWQWSQSASIDGIEGSVDADRFNGNDLRFRKLLIQ